MSGMKIVGLDIIKGRNVFASLPLCVFVSFVFFPYGWEHCLLVGVVLHGGRGERNYIKKTPYA